jgi:hypothetical protein
MININFKAKMLSAMIASLPMLVIGGSLTVKMSPDELWWGAANYYGSAMPFSANTSIEIDLRRDGRSNQYASLLLSTKGRAIWCEEQALFKIKKGKIDVVSDKGKIEILDTKKSLRDAFLAASKKWFPPSGKTPDLLFFSAPQYNTWIELTYNQNEKDILSYAKSMIDNGLPPGVLMIDDTWQAGYGDWRFEPSRFSDPKGMMDKLHKMGYKVILWMCPFVGMDTPSFRRIERGIEPLTGRGLKSAADSYEIKTEKVLHAFHGGTVTAHFLILRILLRVNGLRANATDL